MPEKGPGRGPWQAGRPCDLLERVTGSEPYRHGEERQREQKAIVIYDRSKRKNRSALRGNGFGENCGPIP